MKNGHHILAVLKEAKSITFERSINLSNINRGKRPSERQIRHSTAKSSRTPPPPPTVSFSDGRFPKWAKSTPNPPP